MNEDLSQVVYAIGRLEAGGDARLLGTAFAVGGRKVATAYHVAGANTSNMVLAIPRIASIGDYQDTSETSIKMIPLELVAADPMRDLAIFSTPSGTVIQHSYSLGGSDTIPPGTAVETWGFPHAISGRMVLTQQKAHVGARILINSAGEKSKHIVLNTQAREGQSGGPVLDARTGVVAAVLIGSYAPGGGGGISLGGVDPATLHQTTHAVSAEYLQEML